MSKVKTNFLIAVSFSAFVALGCSALNRDKSGSTNENPLTAAANQSAPNKSSKPRKTSSDLFGETEKQKPAPGKGNVQGKVFFNDQPVEGIEVRLCENFSMMGRILCTGKTLTAKTDKDGVYVVANAEPLEYEGVMAKVFKTNYYISPQEGFLKPQKFPVEADKTIFADDIHLFKDDLKVANPKAGAKVDANNLELKWNEYPDASYYKVTLNADAAGVSAPVSGERVEDATSYMLDKPLTNGKYRIQIEAYNSNDHKLAETPDDIKFTVVGGADAATEE